MQELTRLPGDGVADHACQTRLFLRLDEIFARSSLDGIRAWEPKSRVIDFPGFWLRPLPLDFLLLEQVEQRSVTERLCPDGVTQY
jgi:hypothetical protein